MAHIYIGGFSLYELAALFFIYSFLGWCCEVIFATVKTGKFVNRGFLNGPVCPIYGTGAAAVLLCLTPLEKWFPLVFLAAALLCSAIEFLTGFILEKFFRRKWWDYSDRKFNLMGYICPEMGLLWGIACLLVVYAIQPAVAALLAKIPLRAGYILLGICAAAFVTDLVFTVLQITKLGRHIKELEKINRALRFGSDALGMALSGVTAKSAELFDDFKKKSSEKAEILKKRIAKSRLARAFPKLRQEKEARNESTAENQTESAPSDKDAADGGNKGGRPPEKDGK